MSGPIANWWNGAGLASGTPITTANVNQEGNGSAVTLSTAFPGETPIVKEGAGFRVVGNLSSSTARLNANLTGRAALVQIRLTVGILPNEASSVISTRSSSAAIRNVVVTPTGQIGLHNITSVSPSVAAGDKVLIDAVVAQSATPTASNGRVFFRVKNLTNPTWNTTGEFFYDSGYTVDNGTAEFASVRAGKQSTEVLPTPGFLYEHFGWQSITVNPSDLSVAQAKSYFADAPVDPVIAFPPTSGDATPVAGPGTGDSGWVPMGGAASEGEALSDDLASTYVESPDITSTATERIYTLARMTPRNGLTLTFPSTDVTAVGPSVSVRLYSAGTLVASKPLTVTTSKTNPAVTFTAGEVASVNWNSLSFGLRAVL